MGREDEGGGASDACASAVAPARERGDHEGGDHERHGGQVGADADEAVGVQQAVEEEALVQVLEQVVSAAQQGLRHAAQRHFVVPAFAHGAQRQRVDVPGREGGVCVRGGAFGLAGEPVGEGAQAGEVGVG